MMRPAGRQRLLWVGLACILSAACGSTRSTRAPVTIEQRVEALGIELESLVRPLELTPEMKEWAWTHVRRNATEKERLYDLMDALVHRQGLAVRYQRDSTGTAREVFESGEANCLAFTHLFIALSREVGVRTYFLIISRNTEYAKEGDLVLRWEHVTAGWGPSHSRTVLEFGFIPSDSDYLAASRVSDLTALAMFYSNRGAEALLAGDKKGALSWLETAVALEPAWSHGWLNLGVVRRRMGDLEGAEQAYREGIESNPEHIQLYSNLAALLRFRGEVDSAGELLRLLDRKSNRNPFSYLTLGDMALREERLDDAKRFYRRALQLSRNNAEIKAAMGLWELASNRPEKARTWLERAERLDSEAERVVLLRSRLSAAADGLVPAEGDETEPEPNAAQRRSDR